MKVHAAATLVLLALGGALCAHAAPTPMGSSIALSDGTGAIGVDRWCSCMCTKARLAPPHPGMGQSSPSEDVATH